MTQVFEPAWIQELEKRYGQRPKFQQPALYRLATRANLAERRALIEAWVQSLTPSTREVIIKRLRNPDQFFTAYNELAVGDILRRCGHKIEYEKPVDGKTPDWYISARDLFPTFLVEVATVFPPREIQVEMRTWEELRFRIAQIEHYFHLSVTAHRTNALVGKDTRPIAQFVKDWLDSIDPKSTDRTDETVVYKNGDLRIELDLIARKTTHKKPVEILGPVFTQWVNDKRLRNAIAKKLSKYPQAKQFSIPLVVGVVPTFESGLGIDSLFDVLFGKEQVSVLTGEWGRDKTGMFLPKIHQGQTIVFNTRLSAILLLEQSNDAPAAIVHNPYAKNPLPPEVFSGLRNLIVKMEHETYLELDWVIPQ